MYVELNPAGSPWAQSQQPCRGLGCGMGALTMDGTGLLGTGLFSGGVDLSTWGVGEYAVLAIGVFAVFSMFSTTSRGVQGAQKKVRRLKQRVAAA